MKNKKNFIIIILFLFLFFPLFPCYTNAEVTIGKISTFNHQIILNENGFLLFNETIVVRNDFEDFAILPSINITYPFNFYNLIIMHQLYPTNFDFNKVIIDNYTIITISPSQDYIIPPNSEITISLQMYLVRILSSDGELNYKAFIPLVPGLNVPVEKLDVAFYLPIEAYFSTTDYENFTITSIDNKSVMIGNFFNVDVGFFVSKNITITAYENLYFALLEFPKAERNIILSTLGEITVSDSITIINYGDNEISKIKLNLLTNDYSTIRIFPPLINYFDNSESDAKKNQIDIGTNLKKGEKYTVKLEYPIKSENFINIIDNSYNLYIPLKPSAEGVIKEYKVKITFPNGFFIKDKTDIFIENANPLNDEILKLNYQYGFAWASIDIIPFASSIFLIGLFFSFIFKKSTKNEVKEVKSKIENYIGLIDEKISINKEMLETYKRRQSDQISQNEFITINKIIDKKRNKISNNIGTLLSTLIDIFPSFQKEFSDIGQMNHEYERAFRDIVNLYQQLFNKKIKLKIFERLSLSDQNRLNMIEKRLLDKLELLSHDLE